MKIALLSGASSIHTIRWANGLSEAGVEVVLISQQPIIGELLPDVKTYVFSNRGIAGYFLMVPSVRKLLRQIQPDLVNAHYASGYGTTARLVNYRPWLLSVWGSDVFDFPYKSPMHRWMVTRNLCAADAVASTSHCMEVQTRRLCSGLGPIAITPFGVDLSAYKNTSSVLSNPEMPLVIGTVKTMSPQYGIDTLIKAFSSLLDRLALLDSTTRPEITLRLVGGGGQTAELKTLAAQLGIADKVDFVGQVPHAQVPQELSKLDIYVALSRRESFGVAILEAGAACRPVVVSDAGGLLEVTVDGVTGIIVPRDDPTAAAAALERLVIDSDLRFQMGHAGRCHVAKHYSWNASVETMLDVYEKTIRSFHDK